MPEIIEVDLVCQQLGSAVAGRTLTSLTCPKPLLRPGSVREEAALRGAGTLLAVTRHAKELFFLFSGGAVIKSHLGMSGVWLILPTASLERELAAREAASRYTAASHLRYLLAFSGDLTLAYYDARGFGQFALSDQAAMESTFANPDILHADFSLTTGPAADIWTSKRPLYHFLHDQGVLPGMGAYLGAEWLFRCRVHPLTPAQRVATGPAVLLHNLRQLLVDARTAQGASFSNYLQASGEKGTAHTLFQVYGREGESCFVCGSVISKLAKKRGSQFCPSCQKLR